MPTLKLWINSGYAFSLWSIHVAMLVASTNRSIATTTQHQGNKHRLTSWCQIHKDGNYNMSAQKRKLSFL